uniref:hydroxymethylpyrimidine kinase n=1 Tax=Candidatus Kentrum sp. MB TaxID=2138164 RepID=A0A450XDZ9_9GAMM|nr:MAG: hydroxymethylpyrimidine/phosphomethylpyrimidine kinase [Candidatus Kentron sp. MB]VFK32037.1 MAG: hydroxymethylpyrimidine/phosphomethylpyrimidine kinase [Candidatus Kentron sp. MB]VFK75671.1 MAG: hydroxymethylpyrimidine/phosphomethylpyrimidine kinase [Candidatus Kentron sp. MB]
MVDNKHREEPPMTGRYRAYRKVLTIAGSDSGGGAGVQADLKTISALGCYGMSVITALTAQNTRGVTGIHVVPSVFVAEQLSAVLTDMGADAIKIGMLYSAELIRTIADGLRTYAIPIVLDPLMAAESGGRLLQRDALEAMKEYLMPLAKIITPNIPEAEALLGRKLASHEDMREGAKRLAKYGSRNVLIKGGHGMGPVSVDFLYLAEEDRVEVLEGERIHTRNNHGTGCTLSSAIASYLAKGHEMEAAVREAKSYIGHALQTGAGYTIGQGHGPVHHFFRYWT